MGRVEQWAEGLKRVGFPMGLLAVWLGPVVWEWMGKVEQQDEGQEKEEFLMVDSAVRPKFVVWV